MQQTIWQVAFFNETTIRLHEQAELAGSLIYLSTALRCYYSAPRNCGEGLQATRDASSLVYRSVVLRCYRVVTRNGLDTSKTRRNEYPDRRVRLYVTEGHGVSTKYCDVYKPFLRRIATYISRFLETVEKGCRLEQNTEVSPMRLYCA